MHGLAGRWLAQRSERGLEVRQWLGNGLGVFGPSATVRPGGSVRPGPLPGRFGVLGRVGLVTLGGAGGVDRGLHHLQQFVWQRRPAG